MPDLLTHFTFAFVTGKFIPKRKIRVFFYFGTILPDLCYRMMTTVLHSPGWYAEVTNSPLWIAMACFLFAHIFPESDRKQAFITMLIACAFHLFMDSFKNYFGYGVIFYAFPFSLDRIGLGMYWPEETAWFPLFDLGIILLVETGCRIMGRK